MQDALTLEAGSRASPGERAFFTTYQAQVGWSASGRVDIAKFLSLLAALPIGTQLCLRKEFGVSHLIQPHDELALREWFVQARHIDFHGRAMIMPILELANHSWRGAPYEIEAELVGVSGLFPDGEILLRYSLADSWKRF